MKNYTKNSITKEHSISIYVEDKKNVFSGGICIY